MALRRELAPAEAVGFYDKLRNDYELSCVGVW